MRTFSTHYSKVRLKENIVHRVSSNEVPEHKIAKKRRGKIKGRVHLRTGSDKPQE